MCELLFNIHPRDCFQHQSQQHHLCPAIPLSSLATMADVFLSIGNVTEIKTVVTDPTSRAAVPVRRIDLKHCSLTLLYTPNLVCSRLRCLFVALRSLSSFVSKEYPMAEW